MAGVEGARHLAIGCFERHAQVGGERGELAGARQRAGRMGRHLEGEDVPAQGPQGRRIRGHLDAVGQGGVARRERP